VKEYIADWAAALFVLTLVYVLVRPNSKAADAVSAFSSAMAAIVRTAVDL
jgi:Na+/H+ antiporter NhaD/arsenite permease-like protein